MFADRSGAVLLNELITGGFLTEGCSAFIRELQRSNDGGNIG